MAHLEAGKTRKGKNFSSDEELSLCRSFLDVSQDPICGNGQRNSAFWERITTHFNRNKPRANPVRTSRSLETKWGQIKHDVGKFCGTYKQVYDCRVSGTSLDDVVEKALEFYRERHPKQQSFMFLHCWQILKEVPRWWDTPINVQRRANTQDSLPKTASMPKRKSPPTSAAEAGTGPGTDGNDDPNGSDEEVQVVAEEGFPRRPTRPQGGKAAKGEFVSQAKREKILQHQVLVSERMAEASLLKATAMHDQFALSLFTMPSQEGLTDQAQKYIEMRRTEEMERLERRIQAERRAAQLEQLEHERLLKERNFEAPNRRRLRGVAARVSPPVVTAPPPPAPPRAPSPSPDAGDDDDSWDDETSVIPDTPAEGTNLPVHPYFSDSQGMWTGNGTFDPVSPGGTVGFEQSHCMGRRNSSVGDSPGMFRSQNSYEVVGNDARFTESDMRGYRNGGQGLNLNAHFYTQ